MVVHHLGVLDCLPETDVIEESWTPKFEEYFNITSADVDTDNLLFTIVINGKPSETLLVPIRTFPVGEDCDQWLKFNDSSEVRVKVTVEIVE